MNETIKTQLNHRSIRQFKPLALTQEEVDLLVDDVVKLRAWVDGRRCVQRPIVGNLQGQAGNIVLVEVRCNS